ncbi:sucrase-isomaltase, intestinal-like [Palaemon carinicauda]|uniref:sucrase-isomaltase, intestinal-like n=1 Tax=Palaemon carinicauda TaxID=392227 RepID=UPI0035B69EEA
MSTKETLIHVLALINFLALASAQLTDLLAIECPFPEGQDVLSEEECARYSACQWTEGRCHMVDASEGSYLVTGKPILTERGFKVDLVKANDQITMFGGDVEKLVFEVIHHEEYHLQIKIYDADHARYEVPVPVNLPEAPDITRLYSVAVSEEGQPLEFSVSRKSNGNLLFKSFGALTFEDQFLQVHTTLPSTYLYGFGENTQQSFRRSFEPRTTFPIFARDQPIGTEEMNVYGHYPYYMVMEDDEGNSHSVLLFNSNAMEYSTYLLDDGSPAMTLRTIGGILDFHVFLGPYPEDLVHQYTGLVGNPMNPPYWALGFQLSRWGYNSTNGVRETRERMRAMGIPQDVQTLDIDYMDKRKDFTYDPEAWADLPELIQELHNDNLKVTLILDPALVIDFDNYQPSSRGKASDVFIKWGDESLVPSDQEPGCEDYVVGYVWPEEKTVFPDFLKPETHVWWQNELKEFHDVLPFDAIWIDMNEPSNFGTNLQQPWNWPSGKDPWSLKCPNNTLDLPPYPTKMVRVGDNQSKMISDHTLCMSAKQTDGDKTYSHYDVHSLYGWSETVATYNALQQIHPEVRPVVLSRSTFPGSGQYAIHWLGDNAADWDHMHMSIIGMLDFNMFGLPLVGADICGFFNEPDMEMCARWMQLGAFYPFSRNHNTLGARDQDPAVWPEVGAISRDVLNLRYKYLPYLYTLFHKAHNHGGSVVRPLLNVYPSDVTARDVDDQFMWGTKLMVAPVVQQGAKSRDVYFPQDGEVSATEGTNEYEQDSSAHMDGGASATRRTPTSMSRTPRLTWMAGLSATEGTNEYEQDSSAHMDGGGLQRPKEPTSMSRTPRLTRMAGASATEGTNEYEQDSSAHKDGGASATEGTNEYEQDSSAHKDGGASATEGTNEYEQDSSAHMDGGGFSDRRNQRTVRCHSASISFDDRCSLTSHCLDKATRRDPRRSGKMSFRGAVKVALVAALCTVAVTGQEAVQAIECPFPEGQDVASETECAKYSACEWTDGKCHMTSNEKGGYKVVGDPIDTGRGFKVNLQKADPTVTMFGDDISNLVLEVIYHENYHVQIKISDADSYRYEVPVPLSLPEDPETDPLYTVEVTGEPLSLNVKRRSNGNLLFQTVGPLTYENQFLQFTTSLASTYLYGFGENTHMSFRHVFDPRTSFPIFARDQAIRTEEMNVYGHHPYYMVMEDDEGNSHSVLLFNSNAMEYSTFLLDDGSPALTMRTTGGIIDLHFFLGPYPEDLTVQYANMVGNPTFPPYWALGFQLSRWGYNSTEAVRETRERMRAVGIPQDVQHFDIDYMDSRRDFTYDQGRWADLPDLIRELHTENMRVSLILDPAIPNEFESTTYLTPARGKASDVFIKWSDKAYIPPDQMECCGDYMVGNVWPDSGTVFPDFLKQETHDWWQNELHLFYEVLGYDALWIDMNEPANFNTNMGNGFLSCPENNLDSPPYPTMMVRVGDSESKRISDHTICMSGNQTDGTYVHYDVHSLYGWSESEATFKALEALFVKKRPVILSRSTFPGSGKYAFHWLGDNSAEWDHMQMSIIGMLDFNMFGIPMVGADICGFNKEPSMEMCARWMELGAFYPFSRNHNTIGAAAQDPAAWPEVAEISRDILLLRYKYLPYLYALFHRAHMHGHSVVRPLLNVFPTDLTGRDIDDQFMWGDNLMIAPVMKEGATARDVYFPEALWYDLITGTLAATGPVTQTVEAPLEVIPVYVRGGSILPWQEPALTTHESRANPFGLTVALDANGNAEGEIFWDDGEEEHVMSEAYMSFLTFEGNELSSQIMHGHAAVKGLNLEKISFYGYPSNPTDISINGTSIASTDWTFDSEFSVLEVLVIIPLDEEYVLKITN